MIDLRKLPPCALIDTGVLIRFLGDRQDAETPVCKAFCDAMIEGGRELFIAAPTIAEVTRYRGQLVPRYRGVTVVPFDDQAANKFAVELTLAKIHETASKSGFSRTYMKYDAMIIACALRAKVPVVVALDSDHAEMADGTGVMVVHPDVYRVTPPSPPPQLILPNVPQ